MKGQTAYELRTTLGRAYLLSLRGNFLGLNGVGQDRVGHLRKGLWDCKSFGRALWSLWALKRVAPIFGLSLAYVYS